MADIAPSQLRIWARNLREAASRADVSIIRGIAEQLDDLADSCHCGYSVIPADELGRCTQCGKPR